MRLLLTTLLAAAAVLAAAGGATAEDWVSPSYTDGAVYAVDLDTLTQQGSVVQSWMRETLRQPTRDQGSGKPYSTTITRRFDDCDGHKFQLGMSVRRDAQGSVVRSFSSAFSNWQDIVPGSVADGIWRTNCKLASPPAEDALVPAIGEGNWVRLGPSADNKYLMYVLMDRVIKVTDAYALVITRSDYAKPENISGYPIRYIVQAAVVDCQGFKWASLGLDSYVSAKLRAESARVPVKDLKFDTILPGSFLANSFKQVCAAAIPAKEPVRTAKSQGASIGTAWGITKGYLVTASHVVANGRSIEIYSDGQKIGEARVVADDPANDLAILKLTSKSLPSLSVLSLAPRGATLGRSVFTLGYPQPGDLGQRIKMTAGEVSSTSGYQDDARYIQISVPIQQGNSGGPLIGWDGTVLGVVEAKLTSFDQPDAPRPEMVNYAVKASYIRPLIEDLPDLANYNVIKAAGDPDGLVAAARKAVFMVVVSQ